MQIKMVCFEKATGMFSQSNCTTVNKQNIQVLVPKMGMKNKND